MRLQHKNKDPDRRGCEGKLPRRPNVELGMKRREREGGLETGGRGYERTLIILVGPESERVKIKLFRKVDKCYMIFSDKLYLLQYFDLCLDSVIT